MGQGAWLANKRRGEHPTSVPGRATTNLKLVGHATWVLSHTHVHACRLHEEGLLFAHVWMPDTGQIKANLRSRSYGQFSTAADMPQLSILG